MEVIEVNCEMLSHSPLIYVNCLDLDSQMYIKSSNLACRFSTVLGHISFPNDLRERRLCLFLRTDKVKDLEKKASPAIINIKSRCIHEIEDESVDGRRSVLVVFDFDCMENLSLAASNVRPYDDYEGENSIPEVPWLDLRVSTCNCSCYPKKGKIVVKSQSSAEVSSDSSDSGESDSSDSQEDTSNAEQLHTPAVSDDESAMFTEYFKLKGSTFHAHFQDALKRCKRLTLGKKEIPMQLLIEPANKKDENAIVVQVKLDNAWQPVGYIPASTIKKAMDAWTTNEVRDKIQMHRMEVHLRTRRVQICCFSYCH